MNNKKFMNRAINLSIDNIKKQGGPFGCVIVKNNESYSRRSKQGNS